MNPRSAHYTRTLPILAALAASVPGVTHSQSLERGYYTPPASAATTMAAEARSAILPALPASAAFTLDLGEFEGWREALAAALAEDPSLVGLHRPIPTEEAGDRAAELVWTDGAVSVAAFGVCSRHAVSVRARVAATLPDEATLIVYDSSGDNPRGGWTGLDIGNQGTDGAWLPAQQGECLVVVIALPVEADVSEVALWVRSVAHRFSEAELQEAAELAAAAGPAEALSRHGWTLHREKCRGRFVSVCDEVFSNPGLREDMTAVAHYHVERSGRSSLCTGTLINDGLAHDGGPEDPLLLTAAHCVRTAVEAASVDAVFDWAQSRCSSLVDSVDGPSRLLAVAGEYDQALLRLPHWPAGGRTVMGWSAENRKSGEKVYTLHHPGGQLLAYTQGYIGEIRQYPVKVTGFRQVYGSIRVNEVKGITEPGSSGAGLVLDNGRGMIVGALSHGPPIERVCRWEVPATAGYGSFRDFYPRIAQYLGGRQPVDVPEFETSIPLLIAAAEGRESFVRLTSLADAPGNIELTAIDDLGRKRGPVSIAIPRYASLHLSAADLERGRPPVRVRFGKPRGHWRLVLKSDIPIDVRSYGSYIGGLLASTTQAVETYGDEATGRLYMIPWISPSDHRSWTSVIRITNHGTRRTDVTFELADDDGRRDGATFRVQPGQTRQIQAQDLEDRAGVGTRRWKALAYADPEVPLTILSLVVTPAGVVTNLSR